MLSGTGRQAQASPLAACKGKCRNLNELSTRLLTCLPARPALATIFYHLDCYSAHRFALTCQACAREAAHHNPCCKSEFCAKILPKVQSATGTSCRYLFGMFNCAWTGSSTNALPYMYAMSQQPDFLTTMWKEAWSRVPPSFCTDLRSVLAETGASGSFRGENPQLIINLFIHSAVPLHVDRVWLQHFCESAKATMMGRLTFLNAAVMEELGGRFVHIRCDVYRPQGKLEEDLLACDASYVLERPPCVGSWQHVCQPVPPEGHCYRCYPRTCKFEHNTAITGSWCDFDGTGVEFICDAFVGEADPQPEFDRYYTRKLKKPRTGGRRGWRLSERKQSRNAERQNLQTFAESLDDCYHIHAS